ncbi:MAG TPA: DUF1501 domain-containing protein [Pirellulaceae bacterium]|nr:DUF1501 domain-containing protein [Pirellulaceae bacterium]
MSKIKIATRREFLGHGLGLVGVGTALPNFLVNTALAGPQAVSDQRVVVALLLSGGHDGVSDAIPYADDVYHKVRPTIAYSEKEVIKIDDELGLHPKLTGFKELYDQGSMAVVRGTGYPKFNYSHFHARTIWSTADPSIKRPSRSASGYEQYDGWLGKYCDVACKGSEDPKLTMAVGGGRTPIIIRSKEHSPISFSSPTSFGYTGDRSEKGYAVYRKLNGQAAGQNADDELQFVTQTALNANASSDQIRDVAAAYKPSVTYPNTKLGKSLQTIAGMIVGGLSTRIYHAELGGFDTHGNQKTRFDSLMTQMNGAVSAFYKDLAQQNNAERVLTFTYSEFGRRVKENGNKGTDHGSAQPVFLLGPGVKAGVYGKQPPFDDETTKRNNFKMEIDFRSVYASILEKWLGTPSEPILGGKYEPVDCVG